MALNIKDPEADRLVRELAETSGESITEFTVAIAGARRRLVSLGTLLEASTVVEARRGDAAGRELDLLLHRAAVQPVAPDEDQIAIARAARRRFGRGRHPAGLNVGDLCACALARATGEPLLVKSADFARTVIVPATARAPRPA